MILVKNFTHRPFNRAVSVLIPLRLVAERGRVLGLTAIAAHDILDFVRSVYAEPSGGRLTAARKEVYQHGLQLIISRHQESVIRSNSAATNLPALQALLRDAKTFYDSESAHLASKSG